MKPAFIALSVSIAAAQDSTASIDVEGANLPTTNQILKFADTRCKARADIIRDACLLKDESVEERSKFLSPMFQQVLCRPRSTISQTNDDCQFYADAVKSWWALTWEQKEAAKAETTHTEGFAKAICEDAYWNCLAQPSGADEIYSYVQQKQTHDQCLHGVGFLEDQGVEAGECDARFGQATASTEKACASSRKQCIMVQSATALQAAAVMALSAVMLY